MKHINLYQAAFRPPRIILPARKLLVGGVLFLCGLLAVYAWDAWRLAQLRRDVNQVSARAAHLEAQVGADNEANQVDPKMQAEAEGLEARLRNLHLAQAALASGALGSTTGYAAQFRALSRAHVSGAWLTRVEIAGRGHEMTLLGRALTGEDSARLIASLRREPLFVGLSFASLTLNPPNEKTGGFEALPAGGAAPPAPRFLEFTLSARVPEAATTAPTPGLPATVSLPDLLANQAAARSTQ
ncbi:MAG: PilN domain-containing protein [Pseudomonadota bacterium]|nr:PilN domain-containing protein [Pseudomonadota bacterium]